MALEVATRLPTSCARSRGAAAATRIPASQRPAMPSPRRQTARCDSLPRRASARGANKDRGCASRTAACARQSERPRGAAPRRSTPPARRPRAARAAPRHRTAQAQTNAAPGRRQTRSADCILKAARDRRRDAIAHVGARRCRGNLRDARVGCHDLREVWRQIERRLAAATGAVPGELAPGATAREIIKERRWIVRAKTRVGRGKPREVILEGRVSHRGYASCASTRTSVVTEFAMKQLLMRLMVQGLESGRRRACSGESGPAA